MELFVASLKDLFSARMLRFSIVPLVVVAVVMYIAFLAVVGSNLEQLQLQAQTTKSITYDDGTTQTQTEAVSVDTNSSASLLEFVAAYLAGSYLFSFLLYLLGALFILYASLFVAVVVIGFLTHPILKELQSMHYSDVEMIGFGNAFESMLLAIKWLALTLALFVLFIPLYFVPFVNVIALNLPLYYFFHKMMHYDVASNIATRDEFTFIKMRYKNELRLKTLILYLLSLIPFVILFATVFYVIYLGHTYFTKVRALRLSNHSLKIDS